MKKDKYLKLLQKAALVTTRKQAKKILKKVAKIETSRSPG